MFKQIVIFFLLFVFFNPIKAQKAPPKTRILFIIDYSGSMHKEWGEEKKYEIAKKVLFNLADSIQKSNAQIEIGIRVFGHQSHRSKNDCLDSKLEVEFDKNNAEKILNMFDRIEAQGNTPIAYSLIEAANDFPDDNTSINSIILITDGLENCEGDPCDASLSLKKKRISINPYIIGLDIESELISDFECIGDFVNAKDEEVFTKVLEEIVEEVAKKTTVEINLLSKDNKLISNTPITFYNHFSGEIVYNFIHSLDKYGKADTILLDPRGIFDVVVHTFPPLRVNEIELRHGIHNVINIPVIKGKLDFNYKKSYDDKKIDYILRNLDSDQILFRNEVEDKYFISDKYNLTVLTLPFVEEKTKNIPLERAVHQFIKYNGRLVIDLNNDILASLYLVGKNKMSLIKDFGLISERTEIKLQPNNYRLIYIDKNATRSNRTRLKNIKIFENKTVIVN